jgi:hypothetical protein
MRTAQEEFRAMVRRWVGPGLRELGFKGSGQAFWLPSDDFFVVLGFQKSLSSDAARVRFTVNVSVISKAAWENERRERTYLPEKPSANTYYGVPWQKRIGELVPWLAGDPWWSLDAGQGGEDTAAEIVGVIRESVLPAIREVTELRR